VAPCIRDDRFTTEPPGPAIAHCIRNYVKRYA